MNIRRLAVFFKFTKEQSKALLFLFSIIVILQFIYFYADFSSDAVEDETQKQHWLSMQSKIDVLKKEKAEYVVKIYPFNPNFITDYKGYKLGMSVVEIDRLLLFRKQNKYVNSAEDFQKITKVSDSLLNIISPYFKFPSWVKNKKEFKGFSNSYEKKFRSKEKIVIKDINKASQEDLIKIYGIGEVTSLRILKAREALGGFVTMEQIRLIWGLSPEAIEGLLSHYKVDGLPAFKKLDVNNASLKEISQFHYFNYGLARNIITYRSMNGDFRSVEDLIKIKDFPVENAKIISLYLDFN
jgi:DNA uptake protein ComE-like DNA-binding protein